MLISVVVPAYNEELGIKAFNTNLIQELSKMEYNYEIIYINDGSQDNTLNIVANLAKKNKNIKVINLSRNFGKEIATTAGIHKATGDVIIVMDADGQHPPSYIKKFIKKYEEGNQVVIGVRKKEKYEGVVKEIGSKIFYKLFNTTSGSEMIPRSTDFRLITKQVQKEFMKLNETNRITRGLIDWLGFKRGVIYFDSPERIAGKPSYNTGQLVKLATNSFISLSLKPLLITGYIGVIILVISLLLGLFIIIEQIIMGDPLRINFSGPFMLGVFTSFMISIVLVSQSLLAAYVSHIHQATQNRPLYIIDEENSVNF